MSIPSEILGNRNFLFEEDLIRQNWENDDMIKNFGEEENKDSCYSK